MRLLAINLFLLIAGSTAAQQTAPTPSPPGFSPGDYALEVEITDLLDKAPHNRATATAALSITGPRVVIPPGLETMAPGRAR